VTGERLEALKRMAQQDVSPHERDIARAKLQEAGMGWDEPPRRPPVAPAPFDANFGPGFNSVATVTFSGGTGSIYIRFTRG
jgi:hypothetical protein